MQTSEDIRGAGDSRGPGCQNRPVPRYREFFDAILDFFEDAGSGEKLATATTAPRLARIVASLEEEEKDHEGRRARIRRLADGLRSAGMRGDESRGRR